MNIVDYSVIEKKDSGSCKVGFEPLYTSFDVCVTVKEFHIEDCNATVNYYHSGDSEIKAVSVLFFSTNLVHVFQAIGSIA